MITGHVNFLGSNYLCRQKRDQNERGKAVYLVVKRRRWRHKISKNEIVTRKFNLMAKGGKLTQELSDFLKSPDKFERRFD